MSGMRTSTNLAVVPVGRTPPPSGRYVVTVPGQDAPVYALDLPRGVTGPSRLLIAVQQLADQLGVPPDTLLLVPFGGKALWTIAVICDVATRRTWTADPATRPSRCVAVLPDYLTLPAAAGCVIVAQNGDTMMARIGLTDGFSAPLSMAPLLLARSLVGTDIKTAVTSGDITPKLLTELTSSGLTVSDTATAAAFSAGELSVDLRKGGDTASGQTQATIRIGLAAAVVAVFAFGLWVASALIEIRSTEASTALLRDDTVAVLREGLIPAGPILDIRQQVMQELTTANGSGQLVTEGAPLTLLSRATVALFGKGFTLRSLSFTPASGLMLTIVAPDFAAVETLASDMRADGLRADAVGLRTRDGGGVDAQITVTEAIDP